MGADWAPKAAKVRPKVAKVHPKVTKVRPKVAKVHPKVTKVCPEVDHKAPNTEKSRKKLSEACLVSPPKHEISRFSLVFCGIWLRAHGIWPGAYGIWHLALAHRPATGFIEH